MIRRQPFDEREEEISDQRLTKCKEPACSKKKLGLIGKCTVLNVSKA